VPWRRESGSCCKTNCAFPDRTAARHVRLLHPSFAPIVALDWPSRRRRRRTVVPGRLLTLRPRLRGSHLAIHANILLRDQIPSQWGASVDNQSSSNVCQSTRLGATSAHPIGTHVYVIWSRKVVNFAIRFDNSEVTDYGYYPGQTRSRNREPLAVKAKKKKKKKPYTGNGVHTIQRGK
jgi:hypothetical protein